MKKYPTISKYITNKFIYAFDKLDGSNIRAEWSKKRGFYKFGKRHGLLDDTNPFLKESEQLIFDTYEKNLIEIFIQQRWTNVTCFFEFFGKNSFAGNHKNEPHEVILIDIAIDKKGILEPENFIKLFKEIKTANLLYQGNPTYNFVNKVKNGTLKNMTFEGVVCKGKYINPGTPLMFKIKNQQWINKLKICYKNQPQMIEKLL